MRLPSILSSTSPLDDHHELNQPGGINAFSRYEARMNPVWRKGRVPLPTHRRIMYNMAKNAGRDLCFILKIARPLTLRFKLLS